MTTPDNKKHNPDEEVFGNAVSDGTPTVKKVDTSVHINNPKVTDESLGITNTANLSLIERMQRGLLTDAELDELLNETSEN